MFPNSVESGGIFTYVPQFRREWCTRIHQTSIHQTRTLWASTKCACQVEHVTYDLGGMEYEVEFISLSQELTNFFSLNLEF